VDRVVGERKYRVQVYAVNHGFEKLPEVMKNQSLKDDKEAAERLIVERIPARWRAETALSCLPRWRYAISAAGLRLHSLDLAVVQWGGVRWA
jgi:hypothetical protein